MIRLPLSSITLGPSDLKDFETRQQRRKAAEVEAQEQLLLHHNTYAIYGYPGQNESTLESSGIDDESSIQSNPSPSQTAGGSQTQQRIDSSEHSQASSNAFEHRSLEIQSGDSRVQSPENQSDEPVQQLSPSKDQFHFGGFLETLPRIPPVTTHSSLSSPFVPEDSSTPVQSRSIPHIPRRGRLIPRSPLIHSHNTTPSPERRQTTSLSPRVAARMIEHNSPGVRFSRPALRSRRFRHQTNSFSFDESELERSSAAYEQERISSTSSTGSRPRPDREVSLHEELQGSSLIDFDSMSNLHISTQTPHAAELSDRHDSHPDSNSDDAEDDLPTRLPDRETTQDDIEDEVDNEDTPQRDREFIFSSPQLPLPPPFSTTSRNVSLAGSLPISDFRESFIRSDAPSPAPRSDFGTHEQSSVREPSGEYTSPLDSASSVGVPLSSLVVLTRPQPALRNTIQRAAVRMLSSYRSRSPRHRNDLPIEFTLTPSTTPRRSHGRTESPDQDSLTPRTPHTLSHYRIYNDSISPFVQPQTPNHLPEARHQSRYHPSYTAPVGANQDRLERLFSTDGLQEATTPTGRRRHEIRNRNARSGRSDSPSQRGMVDEGFRGLYGGRENGSNEQDWVDGIRDSNVEVRRWGMRDIRDEATRYTPDREERRAR